MPCTIDARKKRKLFKMQSEREKLQYKRKLETKEK